jgi:uncharacterized MAPEG superfamily protein
MTLALSIVVWSLILAFVQIILFDMARTGQYGLKWNTGPRDETDLPELSAMGGRLKRAQDNLFETLPLFIAAVLVAHITGRETELVTLGAEIWFGARVLYVPLYAFGVRQVRSLVWLVSIVGLGMIVAPLVMP